jgi:enoyl-CoA hydratase
MYIVCMNRQTTSGGDGLLVTRRAGIVHLTLDRPSRRNALDRVLWGALLEQLVALDADDDVRVIVLTGTGADAFCAGVDLKELDALARAGDDAFEHPMRGVRRNLYEVLLECRKPTIAALNGHAVGAGCELALACDLRIAASGAMLLLPEAKRGLGANFASVVLPRLLPRALAMEMLYTGEPLPVERAATFGLVNAVVPVEDVADRAQALAWSIAANAPLTVARYKQMLVKTDALPSAAALRLDAGPDPYVSRDRREGIRAFVEGRAPEWEGR